MSERFDIDALLEIMKALRTPGTGCPWDIEQTFETIVPYTVEEAYEVADAVSRRDFVDLRDELGDLLLQVVYHARMAEQLGYFDFSDVVSSICRKMIRRHPHVFGDPPIPARDLDAQWDSIKALEKADRENEREQARINGVPVGGEEPGEQGFLGGIADALPALVIADKLTKRAAKVGFDWPDTASVLDKIEEELGEVREELGRAADSQGNDKVTREIGDLLFAVANLARHVGVSPEQALHITNVKFKSRFRYIEQALKNKGKSLAESDLDEMEALWGEAKGLEAG
ncbi:MAG: nucleoside triphosphate pyrophosphohydrolase [Methylobacteriaceae bacterium]|jgi:ATP diphosphatase|nr:nucleoside triphosphate pyrophosphohydrolase [Methylobacteriaceae bacterium]